MNDLGRLQAALWWNRDKDRLSAAWRWRNQKDKVNFPLWEAALGEWSALSENEKRCVAFVLDRVQQLIPLHGKGWPAHPGGHPVDVWGVDNAIGWLQNQTNLPDIRISSVIRNDPPHNGSAVDFVGTTKAGWQALGRVFLQSHQNPAPYGLGIGIPTADKHLHVDYRPGLKGQSWIEYGKRPAYRELVYTGRSPAWEAAKEQVRIAYYLTKADVPSNTPARYADENSKWLWVLLAGAAAGAYGYRGKADRIRPALYAAGAAGSVYALLTAQEALSEALRRVTERPSWLPSWLPGGD